MKILVLNCGSSSLKYQLFDMENEAVLAKGLCERIGIEGSKLKHQPACQDDVIFEDYLEDHDVAVKKVMEALTNPEYGVVKSMKEINAVGHRVVHGGEYFAGSVIIDDAVKDALEKCSELAPLHNPANLIGIAACEKLMPGVAQVGVFDTAFHQTMPERAYLYAIPYEYYEKYKIRRYGFHGTSHRYVSEEAARMLERPYEQTKTITCHLGNGGSICAVRNGKSIDTTMGFTPLEGLVMGTRAGDVDAAVITFLMEKEKLTPQEMDNILNKKSGVLGISGVSSDFRDIEDASEHGNARAEAALDVFAYKVAKRIGAYAAAMNGVDCIVFTAGLGENSGSTRRLICDYLGYLGVHIDSYNNSLRGKAMEISASDSRVRVLVIPTNEELVIARDTKELLDK
ncbi:acetate/propionate family kinase [Anaerotignum sp. MB30-C6]|uniref:acetate/propionate family kinase n=1 Tax=Anaerotignum sp. MB30-C6 TaxID=3070814 RepID=UPI0027DE0F5A|nr:acetate kinase [Anaerotignum sp. MB30-C6]WMI81741.1 acetate kinase [Anaerotignum sp. MB30-C6]